MKLSTVWLLLLSCITLNNYAQVDSLRRYLIPLPLPLTNQNSNLVVTPPRDIPEWPIENPPPYPPVNPPWWNTSLIAATTYYIVPTCGDTYHSNGKLSSRIQCKDDVFHGLTTYWNENGVKISETNYINGKAEGKAYNWSEKGVKTSETTYKNGKEHGKKIDWDKTGRKLYEYTYAYGRYFKQKKYNDRGGLKSIEHYTYTSSGEQVLHGICINYNEHAKEINRYKNGKMNGISQWFKYGKLEREQLYRNNYLQYQKTWDTNQKLIEHNTYSKTGQIEHLQHWDSNGTLTKEQFHHKDRCVGTWMSYYPTTHSKTLTYYTDLNAPAQLIKKEVWINDTLAQLYKFKNGKQVETFHFYRNGDRKSYSHTKANNHHVYLAWNTKNLLTDSLIKYNGQYIGTGFYSKDDTLYTFKTNTVNPNLPLIRWTIINNDTLRQDYLINSSIIKNQVLQSNYYAKNNFGETVRSGLWCFYNDNVISHAITYKLGEITGRAVYYLETKDTLQVTSYGNYKTNQKEGVWTVITDSITQQYTYQSNKLNGKYTRTLTNGNASVIGYYVNNEKHGEWSYFTSNGEIKETGQYKNNQRVGKWFGWYTNEKGKRKKRKIKLN